MYLTTKALEGIQSKPGNTNHLWIYDRSGSMHYDLPKLGEDLIRLSGMLKVDDTLTLSWFSSEGGQFRTILKGFRITGDNDKSKVEKIVRENLRSMGCTCFSEILHDTVQTIEELKNQYPENTFALVFFTDGHPVVSNYLKEETSIFEALKKLQVVVGEAILIGYGQYYNREFLSRMATEIGAQLVHADKMVEVSNNIEILIKDGKSSRKVHVDLSDASDIILVLGKSSGKVVVYPYDKNESRAYVSDTEKEIIVVSNKPTAKNLDDEDTIYASAYALASQNKMDEALEWLGKVGDKYLIDKIYNAFTTSELGEAINEVHAAVFDSSLRFKDGKKKNYVPKADAFCLLEALEILVNDKDAYFYPSHKAFTYQRTGVASKVKDGYPKFNRDENNKAPFANLVWNNEILNLSVLTRINGKINLPDEGKKLLNRDELECFQWKNYALIKAGFLNVRKLPVSVSKTAFLALQAGGLMQKNWKWKQDEIYILDLKRIPIINRVIANGYTSAKDMAEWALKVEKLGANLKVLKYMWSQIAPDAIKDTSFTAQFNDEQLNYLVNTLAVRADGSYSPPTEAGEVEDYYEANRFQLKVSGWSSLPKVEDVMQKVAEKKKLNAPAAEMQNALVTYGAGVGTSPKGMDYVDGCITIVKEEIGKLRNQIQRGKFAVVLGKRKFNEFSDMNDTQNVVADDGTKVEFVFGKKKIAY